MKISVKLWLMSLTWRLRWLAYEWFVLRPAYARNQGEMFVAFGSEANDHYGLTTSNLIETRDYLEGFVKGVFVRQFPEWFLDSWWRPVGGESIAGAQLAANSNR